MFRRSWPDVRWPLFMLVGWIILTVNIREIRSENELIPTSGSLDDSPVVYKRATTNPDDPIIESDDAQDESILNRGGSPSPDGESITSTVVHPTKEIRTEKRIELTEDTNREENHEERNEHDLSIDFLPASDENSHQQQDSSSEKPKSHFNYDNHDGEEIPPLPTNPSLGSVVGHSKLQTDDLTESHPEENEIAENPIVHDETIVKNLTIVPSSATLIALKVASSANIGLNETNSTSSLFSRAYLMPSRERFGERLKDPTIDTEYFSPTLFLFGSRYIPQPSVSLYYSITPFSADATWIPDLWTPNYDSYTALWGGHDSPSCVLPDCRSIIHASTTVYPHVFTDFSGNNDYKNDYVDYSQITNQDRRTKHRDHPLVIYKDEDNLGHFTAPNYATNAREFGLRITRSSSTSSRASSEPSEEKTSFVTSYLNPEIQLSVLKPTLRTLRESSTVVLLPATVIQKATTDNIVLVESQGNEQDAKESESYHLPELHPSDFGKDIFVGHARAMQTQKYTVNVAKSISVINETVNEGSLSTLNDYHAISPSLALESSFFLPLQSSDEQNQRASDNLVIHHEDDTFRLSATAVPNLFVSKEWPTKRIQSQPEMTSETLVMFSTFLSSSFGSSQSSDLDIGNNSNSTELHLEKNLPSSDQKQDTDIEKNENSTFEIQVDDNEESNLTENTQTFRHRFLSSSAIDMSLSIETLEIAISKNSTFFPPFTESPLSSDLIQESELISSSEVLLVSSILTTSSELIPPSNESTILNASLSDDSQAHTKSRTMMAIASSSIEPGTDEISIVPMETETPEIHIMHTTSVEKSSSLLHLASSSYPYLTSVLIERNSSEDQEFLSSTLHPPILATISTSPSSPSLNFSIAEQPQLSVASPSPPHLVHETDPHPPRITNPSCSTLPICISVTMGMSWTEFCPNANKFRKFLAESLSQYTKTIQTYQIVLSNIQQCKASSRENELLAKRRRRHLSSIVISFFVTDTDGEYDDRLTEICGVILKKGMPTTGTPFQNRVMEVKLYHMESDSAVTSSPSESPTGSGIIAAITISAIAGACLFLLCILLIVMKQRLLQSRNCNPTLDAYSLDSFSINASFRRRRARQSMRSFLNHAFDDPELPSHPLNHSSLSSCLRNAEALEEEFKGLPMNMPRLDQLPAGAEVKNRYANVIPLPDTRVLLAICPPDPIREYINANYVKGYDGKPRTYIACQAPLEETVEDFWRMIWEQQSRVILMITMLEENSVPRCAAYFPESTLDCHKLYGDFQVSLQKKDVREFYTMSTFRLYDLEKNLFREVVHFWYTGWPAVGVPQDPGSLLTFLTQARTYIKCNSGPTVVHCSPGTGRTGVILALDMSMREYEESRSVDILRCVARIRKDRGGAVQTKDQYILIYEVMLEYASRIANQSHRPSIKSET